MIILCIVLCVIVLYFEAETEMHERRETLVHNAQRGTKLFCNTRQMFHSYMGE